jgi:hypothetical protein
MDIGMEHFKLLQARSDFGVSMKSYRDAKTGNFHVFSSNGIYCVLINRRDIHFYRNHDFLVKTKARYSHVSPFSNDLDIINYLELSIFLHANATVVDNLVKLLSKVSYSEDVSHMLHIKQMNYFFNLDHDHHVFNTGIAARNAQIAMIKHDEEFYYSNNSFQRLNSSLNNFIQNHTGCLTELYYSLETDKILFTHDLKWSVINFVYAPSTGILDINSRPRDKYKDSQNALDELIPEVSISFSEAAMYEYVYEYVFKRSVEDLKPSMEQVFNDFGVTFDSNYKDTLKIVDMIMI